MEQKVLRVFRRYENKYLLGERKLELLKDGLSRHMEPDCYGQYSVYNIYFDTQDYALARQSLEKPHYKEKLRLRSYCIPKAGDTVFAEIKKKYDGVVYKRCASMTTNRRITISERQRHAEKARSCVRSIIHESAISRSQGVHGYQRSPFAGWKTVSCA